MLGFVNVFLLLIKNFLNLFVCFVDKFLYFLWYILYKNLGSLIDLVFVFMLYIVIFFCGKDFIIFLTGVKILIFVFFLI